MNNIVSINHGKELISNYANANRFLRLARELERDIKILRDFQVRCLKNEIDSTYIEWQIETFTETMNEYKDNAIKARAMI